jgi:hypothetical protein
VIVILTLSANYLLLKDPDRKDRGGNQPRQIRPALFVCRSSSDDLLVLTVSTIAYSGSPVS